MDRTQVDPETLEVLDLAVDLATQAGAIQRARYETLSLIHI